jgi:hypothetical protein
MSSGGISDHNLQKLSIKFTLINKFKASKTTEAKASTIYLFWMKKMLWFDVVWIVVALMILTFKLKD